MIEPCSFFTYMEIAHIQRLRYTEHSQNRPLLLRIPFEKIRGCKLTVEHYLGQELTHAICRQPRLITANDLVNLQCTFVNEDMVSSVCEFISEVLKNTFKVFNNSEVQTFKIDDDPQGTLAQLLDRSENNLVSATMFSKTTALIGSLTSNIYTNRVEYAYSVVSRIVDRQNEFQKMKYI